LPGSGASDASWAGQPTLMRFARASLGNLFTLVIGLAASVVLTRLLGLEGRGAFALALRSAGILGAVAQWGLPEMMMGMLRSGGRSTGAVLGTGLALVAVTTLILGSVSIAAAPFLETTVLRGVPTDVLMTMVVSTFFTVSYVLLRRVIQLRGALLAYNLVDLAKSAVFLALLAGILFYTSEQLHGAVLAYLVAEVAFAVFCALFVWWKFGREWQVDASLGAQLARSGVLIQVGMVATFLANQAGVFVVNVWGTLADVGYYATALGLATYVTYVSVSIRTVLHARMMNGDGQETPLTELTVAIARHTLVWLLAVAGFFAILGRPIIVTLYGSEFEPAYLSLVWFLPGMVCFGLQQILASYFNARSEFRLPTVGAFIAATVGVLLQLWFTPLFGASGAAAAFSIGHASAVAMYVVMFCRRSGQSMTAILPTIDDIHFYRTLARQLIWADR
jgi:O-antigen/teichoic acid export membrane protein